MNNIDKQYQSLLNDILANGVKKEDRTGTGTISVFGRQIRHKMSDGFPLLTTKKMPFKSIVTELLWFLRGDTNIEYLVDNGCNIWNGDAYKSYLKEVNELIGGYMCGDILGMQSHIEKMFSNPNDLKPLTQEEFINKIKTDDEFAKKWGELGPIYGAQWRNWNGVDKEAFFNSDNLDERNRDARDGMFYKESEIDQIQNLINDLKTNPDSRRLMVNAWNVGELDQMVLPPCHYGFQVYTRELSEGERGLLLQHYGLDPLTKEGRDRVWKENNLPTKAISLMWNQRSVDTFLGLPFNIASYGLLLEIIAKEVNMVPDELIGNLGDVHLYSNHLEQAREQIGGPLHAENRREMLEEAMGTEAYRKAIDELMPFGGGLSEYYDSYKIPYSSREPYTLPTLKIESEVKWAEGDCLPTYSISDFTIENYQSHPTIKAPLSN